MNEKHRERLLIRPNYLDNASKKRLIVVLEGCPLESAKLKKGYVLLNSDEHHKFLQKHNKNPEDYRPDIVHQCLLQLQDSPLNKAGLLEVFLHTRNNVLIKVNKQCRIPRTFRRFSGLMVQLLHKFTIKSVEGNAVLMKVIKNPVTDHLPSGCKKIATSHKASSVVQLSTYVPSITKDDGPVVVVIGGFAHGNLQLDWVDETISISNYPLSAALCCAKFCNAFEEAWGVL